MDGPPIRVRHKSPPGWCWYLWSFAVNERTWTSFGYVVTFIVLVVMLVLSSASQFIEVEVEGVTYFINGLRPPLLGLADPDNGCVTDISLTTIIDDSVDGANGVTPKPEGFTSAFAVLLGLISVALILHIPLLGFAYADITGRVSIPHFQPVHYKLLFGFTNFFMLWTLIVVLAISLDAAYYVRPDTCVDELIEAFELAGIPNNLEAVSVNILSAMFMGWAVLFLAMTNVGMYVAIVCSKRTWYGKSSDSSHPNVSLLTYVHSH